MRLVLLSILCVGLAVPSSAQPLLSRHALAPTVTMAPPTAVTPGSQVKRVVKRRDPIIDGVLKGVALGLIAPWLGGGDQCTGLSPAGCMVLGAAALGALGGLIDAMHERSGTTNARHRLAFTPSVAWRFRF